jgi:hypothetical protein
MDGHASIFGWIRTHQRFVAIVVALALAFTIVAGLIKGGFDTDGELSADADGSMVFAGLTWSRMTVPGAPGGGGTPLGLTWS